MIYACSDLHGYLDLYYKIKEFINPLDKIYYLGDMNDRGPDSWKLIKTIINDSQFICLMGNHEKMLIDAYDEFQKYEWYNEKCELLFYNGGYETLEDCLNDSRLAQTGYIGMLRKLPYKLTYTNINNQLIHLSHAGFSPNTKVSNYNLIWDRNHIKDKWTGNDNEYIVHGHTYNQNTLFYCDNHKINIDCGTFKNYKTILLNLDNFSVKEFN